MLSSIIPYFKVPTVNIPGLGPTPPFGLLVVIGIVIGWQLTLRQVDKRDIMRIDASGKPHDWVRDMLWWTVVTGMIIAKLFDSVFYSHELSLRTGLSSTGGFIGAAIGFFAFFRKYPEYKHLKVMVADTIILGLSVAWIFGRMGCFSVHDHIGKATDFFLSMDFPKGSGYEPGPHHELGFDEMLFTAFMAAVFFLLNLRKRPPGFFVGLVGIMYGPVRFFLDFLRPERTDARYLMLTPAQWGALALTLFGVWMLVRALAGRTKVTYLGPVDAGGNPVEPVAVKGGGDASGGKSRSSAQGGPKKSHGKSSKKKSKR